MLGELGEAGDSGGRCELAAEGRATFDQGDLVAALGGDARGLEAGRTAADHDDAPGLRGRRHGSPFDFAAGDRVELAAERIAGPDLRPAMIAVGAATNLGGAPGLRLVG